MNEITRILNAMQCGDARAAGELLPAIYQELRRLAARRMKQERAGQTLQTTALVHEAYLRLLGNDARHMTTWESRGHFFSAAAEAMRRILIDRARAKAAAKRGGGCRHLRLEQDPLANGELSTDLLDLDEALNKLAAEDPAKAELVKLRFFCGLKLDEAANVLGISAASADRHWAYARAWLYNEMSGK